MKNKSLVIERVDHVRSHLLKFVFNDGSSKEVDFKTWIQNLPTEEEQRYLKPANFRKFRILNGTAIMWGDFDIIFPAVAVYFNDPRKLQEATPVGGTSRLRSVASVKKSAIRITQPNKPKSNKKSKTSA